MAKTDDSVEDLQKALKEKPESHWIGRGEEMALDLFHAMAKRVPAYQDFLRTNRFDPDSVKTIGDFKKVPLIDKDNYLRKYPRAQLCWEGEFSEKSWVISTTSGSTGKPFYFPRTGVQDEHYAVTAELYLRENFKIHERSTLYIDAFAMGAWIGGVFTYEAIRRVAAKGYRLSIITPGINKAEVINSVLNLGKEFDQVIIGCYPPIMKDIVDLGIEEGLDWGDYNLGLVFSAEGFSEQFRDYVVDRAKLADVYTSTLNHYGTVDQGTLAHETALSIFLRRNASADKELFASLFKGVNKQPTLAQYLPEMFYFEEVDGGVVCTSDSGFPLVRYDLKDHGGILNLDTAETIYKQQGKDLAAGLNEAGIGHNRWNLPFVYLYERADFSVTFTGAQIYPEEIRRALLEPEVVNEVTGKFTMIAGYDHDAQNYLEVNVELRRGIEITEALAGKIKQIIVRKLLEENSEYRVLHGEYKEKLHPRIKLWQNGHPLHFSGQGKQKWVKK